MVVSELNDILQLARSLAERKAELDKDYFENFIQPAWNAFVRVHENYKSSFREYIDFMLSDGFQIDVLFEKIQRDSIWTQDLRVDLMGIINHIPSKFQTREEYLWNFVQAVKRYFDIRETTDDIFDIGDLSPNMARIKIMTFLSIGGKNDKKRARNILDKALANLQGQYQKTADSYYKLRTSILS